MARSVDERVVKMEFDNQQFERNVQTTMGTLDKLKQDLKFEGAASGLEEVERAARNVNLDSIASGVEALQSRFSAMGIVGMRVLQNLTDSAMNFFSRITSFVTSGVIEGGINRAMNVENARFTLQGLFSDAEKVEAIMQAASDSVTGTAYSYDAAAKAAAQFAATGIETGGQLETALRAVTGVAATTNTEYERISQIFTTVAGNGRLMGDQLQQLSSAGLNAANTLSKYFNDVASGQKTASESTTAAIKALSQSVTATEEAVAAKKQALEKDYENQKKAYDKAYEAQKKAYDKEYSALQKALSKQYDARKKELDKEYDALSDALDASIEAQEKANDKIISDFQKSYEADVEAYEKATDAKIALIDKQYQESLKLIDEEAYQRTKAIDDEIAAINAQMEAEEKAEEEAERAAKRAELQKAIDNATSVYAREKAQAALAEYEEKLRKKDLDAERKATIAALKDQKTAIKEEASEKKEAAKEQRDAAVDAVEEESKTTLAAMKESYTEELAALKESQKAQINAMKASKKEQLAALKESQSDELEALKESQSDQLSALKESQSEQLSSLKEMYDERLKIIKAAVTAETKTLKAGSGALEMTEADIRKLASEGKISFDMFAEAMDDAFGSHAFDANDTFTGALSNIRAALARIGEKFVAPLIEQKGPLVQMFNQIRLAINNVNKQLDPFADSFVAVVTKAANAVTNFLKPFNDEDSKLPEKFGESLINTFDAVKNVLSGFASVLKPIGQAFRDIFPAPTMDDLKTFSEGLKELTSGFGISDKSAENLKDTFKGIFSIIDMVARAFGSIVQAVFPATAGLDNLGSGFLGITGALGRFLTGLNDADKEFGYFNSTIQTVKDGFGEFLSGVSPILDVIKERIKAVIDIIVDFGKTHFKAPDTSDLSSFSDKVKAVFDGVKTVLQTVWGWIKTVFSAIANKVKDSAPALQAVGGVLLDTFKEIGSALGNAFKTGDFSTFLKLLTSGVIAEVLLSVASSFVNVAKGIANARNSADSFISIVRGTLTNIKTGFGLSPLLTEAKNALTRFEEGIKAKNLLTIAAAVGILALSLIALSNLNVEQLAVGLSGVTVLLGELIGSMEILTKTMDAKELGKLKTVGLAMIEVALALKIMAGALKKLAGLSWDEIARGLTSVTVLLGEIVGVSKLLEKDSKGMIATGVAMIAIAIALRVLVKAVSQLGSMDFGTLAQGLFGVGAILLEIAGFTRLVGSPDKIIATSVAMILFAQAVKMLIASVQTLGGMDTNALIQGLIGVGAVLLEIAGFTQLVGSPKKIISTAIGITIMGEAMKIFTEVVGTLGNFSYDTLVKGLTALGAALLEVVAAVNFLPKGLVLKAAGVVILAEAMRIFADVIGTLGGFSVEELAKGLVAMGAALAEVTIALNFIPNTAALKAAGLVVLAEALTIMSGVVTEFSSLSWEEIAKGLVAMGAALAEMVVALNLVNGAILGAASLIILAEALKIICPVFQDFGSMSWDSIAKAAVAMGAALAEIVIAVNLVNGAILGAASLIIMAEALKIIAPVFMELGEMSWDQVKVALVAMGACLTILSGVCTTLGLIGPVALAGAGILFAIGTAFAGAAYILGGALDKIVDAINKAAAMDPQTLVNTMSILADGMGAFGDGLKHFGLLAPVGAKAMVKVGEALEKMVDPMKTFVKMDADALVKSFKSLADGFGYFGDALHNFGLLSGVGANAMISVGEALQKLVMPMTIFSRIDPAALSVSFTVLAAAFGEFGESLHEFGILSGIGADAMVGVAKAISLLAPALTMLTMLNPAMVAISLITLATSFGTFGHALDEFGLLSPVGAEAMVIVADAVSKLTPSVVELAGLDSATVSSILDTLATAFKGFGEALAETPWFAVNERAEGIGALISNVGALKDGLIPFLELDASAVSTAMDTIGKGFKMFAEALSAAPMWTSQNRAEGIGILVDNIDDLAAGLTTFLELQTPEDVKTAMKTIGHGFKLFAEALDAAPMWTSQSRAEGIGILVDNVGLLADGLKSFLQITDADAAKEALKTIAGGFTGFGKSLHSSPFWFAEGRAEGVATLVDSIKELAIGLSMFLLIDADRAKQGLSVLASGFTDFGKALKKAPVLFVNTKNEGLSGLIDNITKLAPALLIFSMVDSERARTAFSTVGDAIKTFGEALKKTPWFNTGGRVDAMDSLIDSMIKMVDPVKQLSALDGDRLLKVLGGIGGAFKILGDSVNSLGITSGDKAETMAKMVNTLGDMVPVMKSLELVVATDLASKLRELTSALLVFSTAAISGAMALDGLDKIGSSAGQKFVNGLNGGIQNEMNASLFKTIQMLGKRVSDLADKEFSENTYKTLGRRTLMAISIGLADIPTLTFLKANMTIITNLIKNTFTKSLDEATYKKIGKAPLMGITLGIIDPVILLTLKTNMTFITTLIKTSFEKDLDENAFKRIGRAALSSLSEGLIDPAISMILVANAKIIGGFVKSAIEGVISEDAGKRIGMYFCSGIARGISENTQWVYDAASRVARAAYDSVADNWQVASPSKVGEGLGRFFDLGIARGVDGFATKILDASANLSDDTIDTMSDALSKVSDIINSDSEFQPTITPVLDLSKVSNGANLLSSMFDNNRTMQLSSDVALNMQNHSAIAELADALNGFSGNGDVVDAISQLRTDVASLSRVVGNLQVVMDTGTLVGALAPGMDAQLGTMATYRGRGM